MDKKSLCPRYRQARYTVHQGAFKPIFKCKNKCNIWASGRKGGGGT